MSKILISPYSARLPSGNRNPKNYPFFAEVVALLTAEGYEVVQIGVSGEERIEGVGQFIQDWPFAKLVDLVRTYDTWLAVDNFLQHFCFCERLKPGIVVFGPSDPVIWGHPQNINLLRSRTYLRRYQYAPWWDEQYNPDAFVSAEKVVEAVHQLAPRVVPQMVMTADLYR